MAEKRENFSRKREALLAALCGTDTHPTAEELYRSLKAEYPTLSLGTVYRNLNRLCATGQAISLGVVGGYERFDGRLSPHAHLVCTRCGRVVDVFCGLPDGSQLQSLSGETGCKIEAASVTFTGLCPDCAGKEEPHGAEKDHL